MASSVTVMLMTNGVLFEEFVVGDDLSSEDALLVFQRLKNMALKNALAIRQGTRCEICRTCDKCDKNCCSDCQDGYCNCEGHACNE